MCFCFSDKIDCTRGGCSWAWCQSGIICLNDMLSLLFANHQEKNPTYTVLAGSSCWCEPWLQRRLCLEEHKFWSDAGGHENLCRWWNQCQWVSERILLSQWFLNRVFMFIEMLILFLAFSCMYYLLRQSFYSQFGYQWWKGFWEEGLFMPNGNLLLDKELWCPLDTMIYDMQKWKRKEDAEWSDNSYLLKTSLCSLRCHMLLSCLTLQRFICYASKMILRCYLLVSDTM